MRLTLADYANYEFWRAVMPTRNVVLTEHQAAVVEDLVASGRYQNASEVLREGLRLVEKRDSEDSLRFQLLKTAVQAGSADSAAGRYTDFKSSDSLAEHLQSLASKAITSA
jgi:antitoxin ParD1/3/4